MQPDLAKNQPLAPPPGGLASALWRMVRQRWHEPAARRALSSAALHRLEGRIGASEQRHTGQIRVVVETSLPWSYVRRHAPVRERALTLFGKYRVWDTEHNNGVLIYLLLPERAIEIVADRGLARHIGTTDWEALVARMATRFQSGAFEDGLADAVDAVSQQLAQWFPRPDGVEGPNELPDRPVVR